MEVLTKQQTQKMIKEEVKREIELNSFIYENRMRELRVKLNDLDRLIERLNK